MLNNYLAFLVLLSIVFPRIFGIAFLPYVVLLILAWRKNVLYFRLSGMAILFIALYLAYAIGLFAAIHGAFDPTYLEHKLSFIILPFLLSFRFREGTYSMKKLASALIIGVVLTGLYGFFHGWMCYLNTGSSSCWLTVSISPIHHPSYFMAFVLIAVFLAWVGWGRGWKWYSLTWVIPFTGFGFALHLLSLSLAGILFMLIVLMAVFLYLIYRGFGKISAMIALILLPVLSYLFITRVSRIEGEWNNATWYANEYLKSPEEFIRNVPYPASGSEERLILWTVSWTQIKERPMGVGTGNLDEALTLQLDKFGQEELAKKKMNPHNQFLQTGVEIGIIGLTLLLAIIFYGLWIAWKQRNALLLLLISCLAFNSLFESMLQRQSGIVFFTFWILIAAMNLESRQQEIKHP